MDWEKYEEEKKNVGGENGNTENQGDTEIEIKEIFMNLEENRVIVEQDLESQKNSTQSAVEETKGL